MLAAGALSFILHLDVHLGEIISQYGRATYAILFAIVFCETGLVLTPFLPGTAAGAGLCVTSNSMPAVRCRACTCSHQVIMIVVLLF